MEEYTPTTRWFSFGIEGSPPLRYNEATVYWVAALLLGGGIFGTT
jgi:hypothetical protein